QFLLSLPLEGDVEKEAEKYLSEEHEILSIEDAFEGAHEIMAETVSDNATYRNFIRSYTYRNGLVQAELKKLELDERKIYEMYYEFSEPIKKLVSHRVLALNRAEKEDVIKV